MLHYRLAFNPDGGFSNTTQSHFSAFGSGHTLG